MDPLCKKHLRLDSVLSIVDAKHFRLHISPHDGTRKGVHGDSLEAVQQVCFADRVILNKTDLVDESQLDLVTQTIQQLNPNVSIIRSIFSRVPVDELLNIRAFDASRNLSYLENAVAAAVPVFIRKDESGKVISNKTWNSTSSTTSQTSVSTVSLAVDTPLDLDKFNAWISSYLGTYGDSVYRVKGKCMQDNHSYIVT